MLPLMVVAMPLGLSASGGDDGRDFDHVFIIMMENTGYDTLIGNPNAPFINFAASTSGLAANHYGVAHPSQPNYIGATSGALNGVDDDNDITIDVPNIVDQLESKRKTWKAYMQSCSLCVTPLDHSCGNQLYERKHNPFITYKDECGAGGEHRGLQPVCDRSRRQHRGRLRVDQSGPAQRYARTGRDSGGSLRFFAGASADRDRGFVSAAHGERDHDVEGMDGEFGHLHRVG
jgi:hypothetical protein